MKHLIFDTPNMFWRVASANTKYNSGTTEELAGLAMHMALSKMLKYVKKYKPDRIAVIFEGSDNWRKEYTSSDKCLSKRGYKANRVKDPSMLPFFELIKAFEELARGHTSLICLSNPILEGDDVFAGYVQRFCGEGDEVVGVSGDKDFVQLLKHDKFTLINTDKDQPRTLEEVCGFSDADYFMFEKAIRGDSGDNVFSAYPKVRATRLQKCMTDEYELVKLMNETWEFTDPITQEVTKYKVGDLFEENNILMNLEHQPAHIRAAIDKTIQEAIDGRGKYSFFAFNKFCGKFGLKKIADNAPTFADMLSTFAEQKHSILGY
jgi:hypothetical protein